MGAICQHAEASAPRVLVAEDQPHVRDALRLLLKSAGFQITDVATPAALLAELSARPYDTLLLDLNYTRDTDGVTEACGANGIEFGEPRLTELARQLRHMDCAAMEANILEVVRAHAGDRLQDDATLMVIAVD